MLEPADIGSADCSVLVGVRHRDLAEGVRDLLARRFDPVIAVSDERSLLAGVVRLQPRLVVVDLGFAIGDALGLLRRLRAASSELKLIVLSEDVSPGVERALRSAGADGIVLASTVAVTLLKAAAATLGLPPVPRKEPA